MGLVGTCSDEIHPILPRGEQGGLRQAVVSPFEPSDRFALAVLSRPTIIGDFGTILAFRSPSFTKGAGVGHSGGGMPV
jgi:hypothetical protein